MDREPNENDEGKADDDQIPLSGGRLLFSWPSHTAQSIEISGSQSCHLPPSRYLFISGK